MRNRIRKYLTAATPHRRLVACAYMEGQLSHRRREDWAQLCQRAITHWPGTLPERCDLLGSAIEGRIAERRRDRRRRRDTRD
jgi:hypothetical protein